MSLRIRSWKTLPPEHKDYLFIYSAGLVWALSFFFFTPAATHSLLGGIVVTLWCGSAALGAILALIGLITRDNLLLERLGTTFIMMTPLIYSLVQIGLVIYAFIDPTVVGDPTSRLHLVFLGIWLFLFLNKRRRQLSAGVKLAKTTPVATETDEGK